MIVKLEIHGPHLSGVCFIEGIGLSSNVYTLGTDEVTVIDTGVGDSMNSLLPKLKTLGLDPKNVKQIVLTHTHFDHIGGIKELADIASPKLLIHEDELDTIETFGLDTSSLHDGDHVLAGDRRLKVIHTPGHTPGSICLHDAKNKVLFSGDTVFPDGGFGRTDLPGGNNRQLIESLKHLATVDVSYILPGHMEPIRSDVNMHLMASYENAVSWL